MDLPTRKNFPNWTTIPSCTEIGFDIEKNAFLPPDGEGEIADFYLQFDVGSDMDPIHPELSRRLRFRVCPDDGIAFLQKDSFSKFPYMYEATNVAYSCSHEYLSWINNVHENTLPKETDYLLLRTRTKRNQSGEITSATYSIMTDISLRRRKGKTQVILDYYYNDKNSNLESSTLFSK